MIDVALIYSLRLIFLQALTESLLRKVIMALILMCKSVQVVDNEPHVGILIPN